MELLEVQKCRALAAENQILKVYLDNGLHFFAGSIENYSFIWDDANGCFYALRPNVSPHTQVQSPVQITIVPYSNIQNMEVQTNLQETINFLKGRGKTDDEVSKIINNLKFLTSSVNTTNVRTDVGYADGNNKYYIKE